MTVNQKLIDMYEVLKNTTSSDFTNLSTENDALFTTLKNNITNLLGVLNVADTWDDKVSMTLNSDVKTGIDTMLEACKTPHETVISPTGTEMSALIIALKSYKDNVKAYQDEAEKLTNLGTAPTQTITRTIEGSPNDTETVTNPDYTEWKAKADTYEANMLTYEKNAGDAETVSKAKIQLLQALLVPGGTHSEAIGSLGASYSDLPTIKVEDGGTDGKTYSSKEAAVTMLMSAGIPEEQAIKIVDEDIAAGKIKIGDPNAPTATEAPTAQMTASPASTTPVATTTAPASTTPVATTTAQATATAQPSETTQPSATAQATATAQTTASPASTTPVATTTAPASTTPVATTTAPASTTPVATTTAPVSTTPVATTTAPVSTTPVATTTAPVSTTPVATTTAPASTTPVATTTAPASTTNPAAGGNQAAGGTQSTGGNQVTSAEPIVINMRDSFNVRAMIENSVRENNGVLSEEGIKGQTERILGELMTKGETTFNGQRFVLDKMPGGRTIAADPLMLKK